MAVEALLIESGSYLLLEDGTSHLLLESSGGGGGGSAGPLVATSGGGQATQGSAAGLPAGAVTAVSGALTAGVPVLGNGGTDTISATATTGAGVALLGANSPASTLTAPYTWIQVKAPDGTTVFIPAWK